MQFSWTDDAVATMLKLAGEKKTASQIAAVLGVSRNAVIGKMHRAKGNFARRPGPDVAKSRKAKPEPEAVAPKVITAPAPVAPLRPMSEPVSENPAYRSSLGVVDIPPGACASVLKLTAFSCHWPIGEVMSDDFRFCAEPIEAGATYCDHHRKIGTGAGSSHERSVYPMPKRIHGQTGAMR